MTKTQKEYIRSKYEEERGLRSRKELKKNILGMFDELDDLNFHNLYGLLWSLSASRTLMNSYKRECEQLKEIAGRC